MTYDPYGAKPPIEKCGRCDRRVRADRPTACRLPAEDFCRDCARPISERGERLAPRDGFVNIVRAINGRRPARTYHETRSLPEVLL